MAANITPQIGRRGGRKKGSPNKATAEIKALAQVHGPAAIEGIVALMSCDKPEIRLAAFKELLDRGYGRPAQATVVSGDPNAPVVHEVRHTFPSNI